MANWRRSFRPWFGLPLTFDVLVDTKRHQKFSRTGTGKRYAHYYENIVKTTIRALEKTEFMYFIEDRNHRSCTNGHNYLILGSLWYTKTNFEEVAGPSGHFYRREQKTSHHSEGSSCCVGKVIPASHMKQFKRGLRNMKFDTRRKFKTRGANLGQTSRALSGLGWKLCLCMLQRKSLEVWLQLFRC